MKYTAIALCITLLLASPFLDAQETNPADFNGDGAVDFYDFLLFVQGFGKSADQADFNAKLDLDSNGAVDFYDFLLFGNAFGSSSGPTDPPPEPDPLLLYIADLNSSKVEVLNTTTNLRDPNSTIFVSQPRGLAFSNINNHLYIAGIDTFYAVSKSGQRVYEIPLHAGDIAGIESRGGFKIALSPDHEQVFVTESTEAIVEVFDSANGQSLAQIPVLENPSGIAISPDGSEVFTAHGISFILNGNRPLSVIDGRTHALKDTISVGEAVVTRMAISPDGEHLYLNNDGGRSIGVVNVAAKTLVNSFTVGLPSDLSVQILDVRLSEEGSQLFATVNRTIQGIDRLGNPTIGLWGGVHVIDTATGDLIREIQIGQLASVLAIAPDGKTAYAAGAEDILTQASPNLQVFILDLEAGANLGSLRDLSLPVDFTFNASKPAIPNFQIPSLVF